MTRAELLSRISSREFVEWIAYLNLEAHDRDQAQKRANSRAKARRMSAAMNQGSA